MLIKSNIPYKVVGAYYFYQTKEITDLEKSLKAQNVEIGANEIVRTTAVAQKAMEELNQTMMETEIKKETKDAIS